MKFFSTVGRDVNKIFPYEKGGHGTALTAASEFGHIDVVQYLLSKGADPNVLDHYPHRGALECASKKGHLEIVRLLLEHGANPNPTKSRSFTSPLSVALERGHNEIAALLIAKGADVLCRYSTANPLYNAVNSHYKDEATIRLVLGALVDQYNEIIEPEFVIDSSSQELDAVARHLLDSDDIERTAKALAVLDHEGLTQLLHAFRLLFVDYSEGVVIEESEQLDTAEQ